jgi:hypothetical protein
VRCQRPPALDDRGDAQALIGEGRMTLGALPAGPALHASEAPHILVHVVSATPAIEDEEAVPPATRVATPPSDVCRTSFELRRRALRVRTSVDGLPELEAFEALHAGALRRAPQRAFIHDWTGLSLRSEIERHPAADATWHAVVAPSVGRRPPAGKFVLIHESIEGAACAVVSGRLQPANRAVQQGLAQLGLREERPRQLEMLGARLASVSRSGLLSLQRSGEQLVASGLLAAAIVRRMGSGPVIAPLDGVAAHALIGSDGGVGEGVLSLGIAARDDGLQLLVGYASLSVPEDLQTSAGRLSGPIGQMLDSVVKALQLALGSTGLAASAAREALDWLIWPVIAAEEQAPAALIKLLRARSIDMKVELGILCLLPPAPAWSREKSVKVGKVPGILQPIDRDLINRLLLSPG